MSDLDRVRAASLMRAADLDALLLFQPEAFRYATGLDAGVASMWRRGGASAALVPAEPGESIAAILSDHQLHFGPSPRAAIELITHPIWIDYVDFSAVSNPEPAKRLQAAYRQQALGGARPESFDRDAVYGLIKDLLDSRQMKTARIGVDLEFLPAADFAALQAALPMVRLCDGSEVLRRLRCIKSPREITCLRQANTASEAGLQHMAQNARAGMARSDLDALWRDGVRAAAQAGGFAVSGDRAGIAVGPNLVTPDPVLQAGDLIKADMGVAVSGYLSDGTRTYCLGTPSPAALRLFSVIEGAKSRALLDMLRAGRHRTVSASAAAEAHLDELEREIDGQGRIRWSENLRHAEAEARQDGCLPHHDGLPPSAGT